MRIIMFFTIWVFVLTGVHLFIGFRLIPHVHKRQRPIAWFLLLLLLGLEASAPVLYRYLNYFSFLNGKYLISMAYFFLGLMSSLFFLLLIWEPFRLFAKHRLAPKMNPSRRAFLSQSYFLGALGISMTSSLLGLAQALRPPRVRRVRIPLPHLPSEFVGFRLVQISDLHLGPSLGQEFLSEVLARVDDLKPDLVAVTGDLTDGYVRDLKGTLEPLRVFAQRYPTFFVTGNHEYYWNATAWVAEIKRLGLSVLSNENRVLRRGSSQILLAGVTDYQAGRFDSAQASNPKKALENAPPCPVRVLLAHQPRSCFAAQEAGYDLMLSGHTHGGQYWPFKALVYLTQPYVAGLARHKTMWVYVNRGTGYWGPPSRLGVDPEITEFILESDISSRHSANTLRPEKRRQTADSIG